LKRIVNFYQEKGKFLAKYFESFPSTRKESPKSVLLSRTSCVGCRTVLPRCSKTCPKHGEKRCEARSNGAASRLCFPRLLSIYANKRIEGATNAARVGGTIPALKPLTSAEISGWKRLQISCPAASITVLLFAPAGLPRPPPSHSLQSSSLAEATLCLATHLKPEHETPIPPRNLIGACSNRMTRVIACKPHL
jgi:hypothetical protein